MPTVDKLDALASTESAAELAAHIDQNIQDVAALQHRQWETTGLHQRFIERVSRWIAKPLYLFALMASCVLWVGINIGLLWKRHIAWDPPPFEFLDGLMTFLSLITTTIVLIAQNRSTRLEQQHAHLDLQVNLLTEQKATKIIQLIEELRKDMPMVRDRHDPKSAVMQEQADTLQVLAAIVDHGLTDPESYEEGAPQSPAASGVIPQIDTVTPLHTEGIEPPI